MASIVPRLFGRSVLASPKFLAGGSLQHSRAMHFTYVPDATAPVDGEQIYGNFLLTKSDSNVLMYVVSFS